MSIVEDLGGTPGVAAGGQVFGDGYVGTAEEPRRFDPVTEVASAAASTGVEWVQAVIEQCAEALAVLESVDSTRFDAATTASGRRGSSNSAARPTLPPSPSPTISMPPSHSVTTGSSRPRRG